MQASQEDLERISKSPLVQFLESQRTEGDFQSSAEFSISLKAAKKKLGKFALPRPTAWILKFVQCANTLGAEEIRIRMERRQVSISFRADGLAGLSDLKLRYQDVTPQTEAESHLFSALWALTNAEGEARLYRDQTVWCLDEDSLNEEPDFEGDERELTCHLQTPAPGFWNWLKQRLQLNVGLLNELQSFCYASKTQVILDGLPLQPNCQPTVLLNGVLNDRSKNKLNVGGEIITEDDDRSMVFSNWARNKAKKFSCVVRIERRKAVKGEDICLDWIRSGVVIKREGQDVGKNSQMFSRTLIPAEGLRLDLTGFAFQECEESRLRRRLGAFYTWHALGSLTQELRIDRRWRDFLENIDGQELPKTPKPIIDQLKVLSSSLSPPVS